jgi:hypothetical protein
MTPLLSGLTSLVVTAVLFWRCLPRNGRTHPVIGTRWEPYLGVLVTSGISFGLTLMMLGLTEIAAK